MAEGKCETIVFFLDSNSFKKDTNGQQLCYSFFFLEWFEATIKNSFKYKTKEKRKSWKLLGTKFSVSAFDLRFRRDRQRVVVVVIVVVVVVVAVAVVAVVVVAVDEGFLPRGSSLFLTSFRRKKKFFWLDPVFCRTSFFFHRCRGRCRRRWGQRRPNNVDCLRTAETRDPPPGGQTGCAFSRNWTTSRIGKIGKISWSTSLTTLPIKIFETQTSFVTTKQKNPIVIFKKFFTNN